MQEKSTRKIRIIIKRGGRILFGKTKSGVKKDFLKILFSGDEFPRGGFLSPGEMERRRDNWQKRKQVSVLFIFAPRELGPR